MLFKLSNKETQPDEAFDTGTGRAKRKRNTLLYLRAKVKERERVSVGGRGECERGAAYERMQRGF